MEKKKMRRCYGKAITLLSVVLLCGCQKVDIPEEETPISKDNCVEIKSTYVSPVEYYGKINELIVLEKEGQLEGYAYDGKEMHLVENKHIEVELPILEAKKELVYFKGYGAVLREKDNDNSNIVIEYVNDEKLIIQCPGDLGVAAQYLVDVETGDVTDLLKDTGLYDKYEYFESVKTNDILSKTIVEANDTIYLVDHQNGSVTDMESKLKMELRKVDEDCIWLDFTIAVWNGSDDICFFLTEKSEDWNKGSLYSYNTESEAVDKIYEGKEVDYSSVKGEYLYREFLNNGYELVIGKNPLMPSRNDLVVKLTKYKDGVFTEYNWNCKTSPEVLTIIESADGSLQFYDYINSRFYLLDEEKKEINEYWVNLSSYYVADWFIQDNNLVIIDRDSEKGLVLKKIELK